MPDSKDDWIRFFQDDVPNSCVIKPNWGTASTSVRVLNRRQDAFTDGSGQSYSAADLVDDLARDKEFDRFIIQERVEAHPSLIDLTDTEALHATRIVTGIDNRGEVRILFASQRLATGTYPLDTFLLGSTGNLLAELTLDCGTIVKAITGTESGIGMRSLEAHPKTARPLIGFQVPYWQEARELAIDAARKFLPIRTIGWDIAVTSSGPVMIEGNLWWNIGMHSCLGPVGPFLAYAREMIGTAGKGRLPDRNPGRLR